MYALVLQSRRCQQVATRSRRTRREDPFEIDEQAAHLFKHPRLGLDNIHDVWASAPLFYEAKPPADWLMVAEVGGRVLVVPITRPNSGDTTRCRPIGCYQASALLPDQYRRDR